MSDIVIISGSPFPDSRTDVALQHIKRMIEANGESADYYSVSTIPAEDLMRCNFDSKEVKEIENAIRNAKGIVVGSPVYKAAYPGVFKALIDLLPQDIFAHKLVLPVMTGGTKAHLLALEYVLKPLLANLKAHHLKGIYIVETEISKESENPIIETEVQARLEKQLDYFLNMSTSFHIDF